MKKKRYVATVIIRAYEREFSRSIGPGTGKPRRGLWISEGHHSLSHRRFILSVSLFIYFLGEGGGGGGIFNYYLLFVYLVK